MGEPKGRGVAPPMPARKGPGKPAAMKRTAMTRIATRPASTKQTGSEKEAGAKEDDVQLAAPGKRKLDERDAERECPGRTNTTAVIRKKRKNRRLRKTGTTAVIRKKKKNRRLRKAGRTH